MWKEVGKANNRSLLEEICIESGRILTEERAERGDNFQLPVRLKLEKMNLDRILVWARSSQHQTHSARGISSWMRSRWTG